MSHAYWLGGGVVLSGCLGIGLAAYAAAAADGSAKAGSKYSDDTLLEIVITAERRTESLQQSSLAISVLTPDQLREAGFEQARDLSSIDPSIQVGQGGPATQIYIRGVGDFGTTALTSPAVATNIDGVYIPRETGIEGNFFDLDRVEVLKGPQGTLYGRNSSGGAINIVTAAPQLETMNGHEELEAGTYGEFRSEGFVNLPIATTVAVRAAYEIVSRRGYDSQGYDDDRHQSGRVSVLWKPNDAFTLRVTGDVQHIGGVGPGYVIKGPNPSASLSAQIASYGGTTLPSDPRVVLIDPRVQQYLNAIYNVLGLPCIPTGVPLAATADGPVPLTPGNQGFCPAGSFNLFSSTYSSNFYEDNLFTNFSAQADWDLGFATLTVIPAYRQVNDDYVILPLTPEKNKDGSYASSLEVRLGHGEGRFVWTSGLYLFKENQQIHAGYDGVSQWDLLGASFNLDHLATQSQAVFGQGTFSVTDDWRLIGGMRYTRDHKTISGTYQVTTDIIGLDFLAPGVAGPAPGECYGQGSATQNCIADAYAGDRKWGYTSYKYGTEYDLSAHHMIYATYAVGQKSGGFNDESVANGQAATFNPETVKALELGSRNRFFNERLQLNAEGFYWRYDGAQQYISVQTPAGVNISELANVGRATSYGLDLDMVWKVTAKDIVHIGAEGLHSRFNSFVYTTSNVPAFTTSCSITPLAGTGPNESINCYGKPLTHAPKFAGSGSLTHTIPLPSGASINLSLTGQFASSRELTVDYSIQSRAPSYEMGDFHLAYLSANKKWEVAAFCHNFTNALAYTGGFDVPSALPGMYVGNLAAPRTYGVRVSMDFGER